MTYIILFELFLLLYDSLANSSVFWYIYSGIQDGFGPWALIDECCKCFKWGLVKFHGILGNFVVHLRHLFWNSRVHGCNLRFLKIFSWYFLHFFAFFRGISLTIIYPTVLFPPKYLYCQLGILPGNLFIHLCFTQFTCSSLRDHDNNQGDQNWSWSQSRMLSFLDTCCFIY